MILSIMTGTISVVVLAAVLYFYQFGASLLHFSETSRIELEMLESALSDNISDEDVAVSNEAYKKSCVQLAALLLKNEELSDDTLNYLSEFLGFIKSMLIFNDEGEVQYSCGNVEKDRDFLLRLSETRMDYTEDGRSYIAVPFKEDLLLAVEIEDLGKEYFISEYVELGIMENTIGRISLPEFASELTSEIMVANRKTGMLIYGPAPLRGKNIKDYIVTTEFNILGCSLMVVNNSIRTIFTTEYEDYLLISAYKLEDIGAGNKAHIPALLGFGLLVFLLAAYEEFIRTDMRSGKIKDIHYVKISKRRYLNTVLLRRLSAFALIGISCIMIVLYCLQLLSHSDIQRRHAELRLDVATAVLEDEYQTAQTLEPVEESLLVGNVESVRSILYAYPQLYNQEDLRTLAQLYDVSDIYVVNGSGQTVVSSSGQDAIVISTDMQSPTYNFWDVINGFSPYYMYYSVDNENSPERLTVYVGAPMAIDRGMILLSWRYGDGIREMTNWASYSSLSAFSINDRNILLGINSQTGECVFDSSDRYTGQDVDVIGIDEKYLRNGYSGTHMFGNKQCQITSRTAMDVVLLYITDTDMVVFNSWLYTLLVFFVGLFVLTLTLLPRFFVFSPGEDLTPLSTGKDKKRKRLHVDVSLLDNGEMKITESTITRQSFRTNWNEKDASAKLRSVVGILLGLAASYLLIVFAMNGSSSDRNPFLEHIFERNWDRRLNIYAVSYVIIVLTAVWFVAGLLQKITAFVAAGFGWRWKTSGILFSNIIRYAAFIVSIFFTLHNLGVETSTLATSASILTLVVGFGSQSLVSDLIAGIFLIFEGAFHVGDIVTIDNWRGEVIEVGLRTTKVKNELGNVKIFQNSRIYGAINMTSDQSFAVCDVALPQGETLEAFEEKLRSDFFAYASANVSGLEHPLMYEGVISLNGNNTSLRFSTKCIEIEREQLQRDLYRSFRLWQEKLAAEKAAAAASQERVK